MSLPEGNRDQRDNNRVPLLAGVSYLNSAALVQGTFDPATGAQLVSVVGGSGGSATVVGIGPIGQNNVAYDTIVYTNSSTTVDIYTYKTGGTAGTTTATVTITFTDTTKTQISTVVRT